MNFICVLYTFMLVTKSKILTFSYSHRVVKNRLNLLRKCGNIDQRKILIKKKHSLSMSTTLENKSDETVILAAIQMCSKNDKIQNLSCIERLVAECANTGAGLVSLPENCVYMGLSGQESLRAAEYLPERESENFDASGSPSLARLRELAVRHNIYLSVGGFQEKREQFSRDVSPGGSQQPVVYSNSILSKMSNTHIIISPEGRIIACYRKIHLFDAPVTGLKESDYAVPGEEPVVVTVSLPSFEVSPGNPPQPTGRKIEVTIGLSVCYDLRFPEYFQCLKQVGAGGTRRPPSEGLNGGTTSELGVILVPSAFTWMTGDAHWKILLQARAIETQCYVVAAAQAGRHNDRRVSYGQTMIIDPWGKIISQCEPTPKIETPEQIPEVEKWEGQEGICYAHFSPRVLKRVRDGMPVFSHRRPGIYHKYLSPTQEGDVIPIDPFDHGSSQRSLL